MSAEYALPEGLLDRIRDTEPSGPATKPGTRQEAPAPHAPQERGIRWTLAGFGPLPRISTSFGEVHAQAIRERDMVRTQEGALKAVVYTDHIALDGDFLARNPDACAVLVRSGALGNGLPKTDVLLSPEQEISWERHAVASSFLKARDLLGRPGVLRKPEDIMTYSIFHCGEPAVVRMEGLWARVEP